MARTQDAEARILYLLGEGPYRATPATLTGDRDEIRSYALPILIRRDSVSYRVHARDNSVTTNRHVQSCWSVMERLGYTRTDDGPAHSNESRIYTK